MKASIEDDFFFPSVRMAWTVVQSGRYDDGIIMLKGLNNLLSDQNVKDDPMQKEISFLIRVAQTKKRIEE